MAEDKKILLDNLLVVDIPNAGQLEVEDWKWRDRNFFAAEKCTRQLLISDQSVLPQVPAAIVSGASEELSLGLDKGVKILKGADAYCHLIMVTCGMKDELFGEKQTIADMRENWAKFVGDGDNKSKVSPEKRIILLQRFGDIMNAVFADAKAVRSLAFADEAEGLRPVSDVPAVSARHLISLESDQPIMILGGSENSTLKNLKALDHKKRRILVAHADPEQLANLETTVNELKAEGKLKGTYEFINTRAAMERLREIQAVFDVVPLGNDQRDAEMLARWRDTKPPLPPLIHLKGDPFSKERTNPIWANARLPNVFNVEDIQEQRIRDEEHNKKTTTKLAMRVIENCITSRRLERQPVRERLLDDPMEYQQFVSGGATSSYGSIERMRSHTDSTVRPELGDSPGVGG